MAGALEGDVFIGKKAQEFRGLLKIKYPMEHGIVTDWDDMERIWSWVYAEELGTLSEEVRGCSSFCRDCSRCAVLLASCTIDRSTAKPSPQPRRCRTNILRHFQCTRSIYLCASCTFIVRHPILHCSHNQSLNFLQILIRQNNRHCSGFRRRCHSCGAGVRGFLNATCNSESGCRRKVSVLVNVILRVLLIGQAGM